MNKNQITEIDDWSNEDIISLIQDAIEFKNGKKLILKRPVYAMNLFFENSTRTKTSFQMAERKIGLDILNFEAEKSSVTKGETLKDTVHTIQAIGVDLAVIRHPQNRFYGQLKELDISLINAGDGSGEHPSQTLLDLMTIFETFGHFKGLNVLITGDLIHSRVARSDMQTLKQLGCNVFFSGPKEWHSPEFDQYGPFVSIDQAIAKMDILMFLRVQHERLTAENNKAFSADDYHQRYGLTLNRGQKMKPDAIIMHPAPVNRGVEIADELVDGPNSKIFTQMHNGVFARMAMIHTILNEKQLIKGVY